MTIIPTSQISILANLILQGNTLYFVFFGLDTFATLESYGTDASMFSYFECCVVSSISSFFFKKIRSKSKLTLFGYILPVLHYQWLCAITSLFFFQVAFRTGDFNHQVIFIGGLTDGLLATE